MDDSLNTLMPNVRKTAVKTGIDEPPVSEMAARERGGRFLRYCGRCLSQASARSTYGSRNTASDYQRHLGRGVGAECTLASLG
jgi:hypothetical protein